MAPDLIQMSWSHFFPLLLLLLFKIPWPLRSFFPSQTLRSRSLTTVTMASTLQCYWLEWASCFPITVSSPMWTTCTRSLKVWTCNNAMHVLTLASPTCRVHFHIKHPWFMALVCVSGTSIVFDMSLTYILVALLAVILNNVLVERLSMHTRITVGKLQRQL